MAVVQISRIQQRRGKQLEGTGLPQLASGEIGWAIDTQKLYIGNGAVSEGAPYVGNTEILTEHVNILDFAEAYQYKRNSSYIQTGPTSTDPVQRTLQDRFDDRVSIRAFIPILKDPAIDDVTEDIQRAIDELYLNPASKGNATSRVILYFEPGEYRITSELRIPPYAHLSGAGIDSTIIKLDSFSDLQPVIRMVDGNSFPGSYTAFGSMNYLERPRYIVIENMTLKTEVADTVISLDNTDSTVISKVKLFGIYSAGDTITNNQAGVSIRSTSTVFLTENIIFEDCEFNSTGYGVFSDCDHDNITITNCKFYQLHQGISVGGNSSLATSVGDPDYRIPTSDVYVASNRIKKTNHGFTDNQLVYYYLNGGSSIQIIYNLISQPLGLPSQGTPYYVSVIDKDYFRLRKVAGGPVVIFTSTGNSLQYFTSSIGNAGSSNTKVSKCYFDLIYQHGFWVKLGNGNTSCENKFLNVGNECQGYSNAKHSIIKYDVLINEQNNNQAINDYFERNSLLKIQQTYGNTPFIPNIESSGTIVDHTTYTKGFSETIYGAVEFFRFPVIDSGTYFIDYVINKTSSGIGIRTGRIHITINLNNPVTYRLHDDFSYTGNSNIEDIIFSAVIEDIDNVGSYDTLTMKIENPAGNGSGTINYSYHMLTL